MINSFGNKGTERLWLPEGADVSLPEPSSAIPAKVVELAGTDEIEVVWRNELSGWTFRAPGPGQSRYIKWQPLHGLDSEQRADVDLAIEAEKLRWAGQFVRVPRVLEVGEEEASLGWSPRGSTRPRRSIRVGATPQKLRWRLSLRAYGSCTRPCRSPRAPTAVLGLTRLGRRCRNQSGWSSVTVTRVFRTR